MVYPSGRIVSYARDTLGRVTSVTAQANASAAPAIIASNITYKPFGPIALMSYGNGLTGTYSYDGDYRLTDLVTGDVDTFVQDLTYGYDDADNILSIADAIDSGRSQTFTYDSLFRLKTAAASGTYGSITYNYDDVGNRTSVVDSATETYSTDAGSNRLLSVSSGGVTRSFDYDGAGNIIEDDDGGTAYGLVYNKANRLSQVSLNGTPDTEYLYNALGERVRKAPAGAPSGATHFHYDRDGKLIAESSSTGGLILEYGWLDGLPIAEFTAAGAGTPPTTVQVDNSDGGANFTGDWTVATDGSGYIGSNYRQHAAEGVPAGGTVVDNSGASFKTTGIWPTATSPAGFEGSNYQARNKATDGYGTEIIVDNTDAGFTTTDTWTAATSPSGFYGSNYSWHYANQAPAAAAVVDNDTTGTSMVGTWSTSTSGGVYGANTRWRTSTATGNNQYIWTLPVDTSGDYKVYAWWRKETTQVQNAPYTTHHAGGSTTVTVNQKLTGNKWTLLGTYSLAPGENHRVVLTDAATDNLRIAADAVAMAAPDATPWKAVWTPTLPQRDEYEVYARWVAASSHATNAAYTIHHESGSATVTKNQQASGGSWQLLGTFTMAPGQNHRVELSDVADGTVVAAAVKFVPKANATKTASWAVSVGSTGSYKVYAKWPASSQHATDVAYAVTHAGGTSTVTVNQRVNGGQWNLLGTYSFETGTNYKVELSDAVAAGKVAADAIYIAPAGAPSSDAFTWTPAIPSSGTYTVYARWPASSANTGAAEYTVTHAGGTAEVTLNQKQNGGSWVPLGSWNFAPGAGHKVTLAAAAEGTTIADAMLFVAAGAQPANLLYVHADHLGSPQKMTDASQATVWDGVFDPFGEEIAVTGLAAMPLRFPGQYADEETGYSYNYFRDYDPRLGRYLQSDPIGLWGGINTYAYVGGNPIGSIDPTAERSIGPGMLMAAVTTAVTATATGVACQIQSERSRRSRSPTYQDLIDLLPPWLMDEAADAEREKSRKKGVADKDIGPSGKPKYHDVDHATRKRAKDAARNEGKGKPMNHPSPTVGEPHMHPTDEDGNKIPGVHHNYPR